MKKNLIYPALLFLILSGCLNQDPAEINLHSDECAYCKMVISDAQFASQMVSDKGRSYPFDSIECMAAYAYQNQHKAEGAKFYIADYTQNSQWLLLNDATIYHSESVKSPMGLSLFALPQQQPVPAEIPDAEKMDWNETMNYIVATWRVKK